MASEEIKFSGFGQLSDWLKNTKAGHRFQRWWLLRNWRTLLSSPLGQRLVQLVERGVLAADRHNWVPIVVEISSDGGVRVFGRAANVLIVNKLAVQSDAAECLAEEWIELSLKGKHREVYTDARCCLAMGHTKCGDVGDLVGSMVAKGILDACDTVVACKN